MSSIRGQRFLTDRCNIYRREPTTVDGLRTEGDYEVQFSNCACRYFYTTNIADPTDAARQERAQMETLDQLHLQAGRDIREGDYVKDVSLDRDGNHGPTYGTVHRVLGDPARYPGSGIRQVNKSIVLIMPEQHPPSEITA